MIRCHRCDDYKFPIIMICGLILDPLNTFRVTTNFRTLPHKLGSSTIFSSLTLKIPKMEYVYKLLYNKIMFDHIKR